MIANSHPEPIKQGEKRPFYGVITAPSGSTVTISGNATCTLYDMTGAVVSAVNGVNTTGQESGAQSELLVWYSLDVTTLALANGLYHLVFSVNADGSDGINRNYKPSVFILVEAASA